MSFKSFQQLYNLGARKIGFVGLPPIGCVPSQRTLGGGILRECEETRNQAAQLFNFKIQKEIQKIFEEFTDGGKIYYIDIFDILLDLIQRPEYYGNSTYIYIFHVYTISYLLLVLSLSDNHNFSFFFQFISQMQRYMN